MQKLFTSEQVSNGHPDKICDQISDAVLDYCLTQDKKSRVACEVFGKNYDIVIGGEITSTAELIPTKTVSNIVKNILYQIGVENVDNYKITDLLDKQSSDIAMGVDDGGAGDQGLMFGYACNETSEYMPLAWTLANEVLLKLRERKSNILLPDAKSQVTIKYNGTSCIDTFLISTQHKETATQDEVRSIVVPIMKEVAEQHNLNTNFKSLVNPTGRFAIGGFIGDAGLTGRKIIADTYGGYARHGGGAFSGKDPTKVDRSGAYAARWIAKNIVALGLATKCEIQIAYAIGVKEPISLNVETFGTGIMPINEIQSRVLKNIDLTPRGIIKKFDLQRPIYFETSTYGHFGKDIFPWEKVNMII